MLDVLETLANTLVRQSEDCVLSVIENILRLVLLFKRFGGNLICDLNKLSQQRLATYHLCVLTNAGNVRQAIRKVCQKENATR